MLRRQALVLSIILVVLLLAACQPTGDKPPSTAREPESPFPSPTPATAALSKVARRLESPPRSCPGPHPRPTHVASAYAPLVGEQPLWAGVYARLDPKTDAYHAEDAPRTRYGFRVKVLWVMSPNVRSPVSISGHSLARHRSLWFKVEDLGTAGNGTRVDLDPARGGTAAGGWKEFPSYVFFDGAGCFELRAASPGGSWRIRFGFGS